MNTAILIQSVYPETDGVKMLELISPRHSEYCKNHDIDYACSPSNPLPYLDPKKGSWAKIELISRALAAGYKNVIWLDADTLIKDMKVDLRDGCIDDGIGACWHRIPQLHHWNVGALYISNTERVRNFITEWIGMYPGTDGWFEQGVFNKMAMQSNIVNTISDKWNATINYTEVPDAVVLGYHGAGDFEYRLNLMRSVLEILTFQEKAETDPDRVR